ncbi:MAG: hypothetical protein ACK4E8_07785 [Lacibacter sp.]|jgi:hypothetical protein
MKKLIALLFVAMLGAEACIKPVPPNLDFCAEGHIFWGGDPAAGGLGWYFAIRRVGNWTFYQVKENELPAQYRSLTDSVPVNICLKSTREVAPCPCAVPSYYYTIKSISRR